MFRWADGGNLREFWQSNKRPQLCVALVRDFVLQLRGLADALDKLHDFAYRHGDVKPENILRVRTKTVSGVELDVGILKIADMGLAKHHTVLTEFRPPTSMKYTTYRYEPPEVTPGVSVTPGRSRRQDIWSIGCVTLELIIWLLYGAGELNDFNSKDVVGEMGELSPYFKIEGKDHNKTAKVHPAVVETMEALSKDQECRRGENTAIKDLLAIVKTKLLVVNLGPATIHDTEGLESPRNNFKTQIGSRASAQEFCLALDEIISKGTSNESYWYSGKSRDHIQRLRKNRSRGSESLLAPDYNSGNGHSVFAHQREPVSRSVEDITFTFPTMIHALKV